MKILTIHPAGSGASRLIPLYVLEKRYLKRQKDVRNFFLVPSYYHEELKKINVTVVDIDNSIDYNKLTKLLKDDSNENIEEKFVIGDRLKNNIYKAIKSIKPEIVIEDMEPFAVLPCKENNIPRISLQRTGQFRSLPESKRNPKHVHSCEKSNFDSKVYDASIMLGHRIYDDNDRKKDLNLIYQYPDSEAKIIPGIKSIEVLPTNIKNRDSYFYCGPLTVEDNPSSKMIEDLEVFFESNKGNKIIFITTGLVDNTSINEFIDILFDKNYAIISTVDIVVNDNNKYKFLYSSILPLNYVCSKVDLVIHQCGSGIYHYPIMNEVASITIGTRCYDREDVAIRLEFLNVSKHVPHALDDPQYIDVFKNCLELFEKDKLCNFESLKKLKEEIYETMLSFDINEVIQYALAKVNK